MKRMLTNVFCRRVLIMPHAKIFLDHTNVSVILGTLEDSVILMLMSVVDPHVRMEPLAKIK